VCTYAISPRYPKRPADVAQVARAGVRRLRRVVPELLGEDPSLRDPANTVGDVQALLHHQVHAGEVPPVVDRVVRGEVVERDRAAEPEPRPRADRVVRRARARCSPGDEQQGDRRRPQLSSPSRGYVR
jgi:hypothetical protein